MDHDYEHRRYALSHQLGVLFPYISVYCLAFALAGWSLSLRSLMLFAGIFLTIILLALSLRDTPWLYGLLGYIPQMLFLVLTLSLLLSLVVVFPVLITVAGLPGLATFLLWQEMRSQSRLSANSLTILALLGLFGLGIGELVDLYLVTSERF